MNILSTSSPLSELIKFTPGIVIKSLLGARVWQKTFRLQYKGDQVTENEDGQMKVVKQNLDKC